MLPQINPSWLLSSELVPSVSRAKDYACFSHWSGSREPFILRTCFFIYCFIAEAEKWLWIIYLTLCCEIWLKPPVIPQHITKALQIYRSLSMCELCAVCECCNLPLSFTSSLRSASSPACVHFVYFFSCYLIVRHRSRHFFPICFLPICFLLSFLTFPLILPRLQKPSLSPVSLLWLSPQCLFLTPWRWGGFEEGWALL